MASRYLEWTQQPPTLTQCTSALTASRRMPYAGSRQHAAATTYDMPSAAAPSAIATWLASVPPAVWSGLIGTSVGAFIAATVSILGVQASNKASLERLREQHRQDKIEADAKRTHETEQKNEDRKAAIRREIYGQAVEDTHALLAAIGAIADRPVADLPGDGDALQAFLRSNAKVWLVADPPAARLTRELASAMAELFLSALLAAGPSRQAADGVRRIDVRIANAESDIRDAELDMRREVADRNDDRMKAHAATIQWIQQSVDAMRSQRQAAVVAALPERLRCFEATFDQLSASQRLLTKLVSALRKELHLDPDEAEFERLLEGMKRQAWDAIHRIYAQAGGGAAAASPPASLA